MSADLDRVEPRPTHPPEPPAYRPGPHRLALLTAALTLPLLFVGGSVTSYGVGLAVPDWPTTFGANMFLYNFWNDPFGVKLEHSHRLFGALVGLTTIGLTGGLLYFERRRWVKVLGVVALAAVITQGVMGGLRVNQISTLLAAVHGGFAQAFFGLVVVLCVVTGRVWQTAGKPAPDADRLRGKTLALVALVYGQIAAGAWYRHFRGLDALALHSVLALAVVGAAHVLAARAKRTAVAELRPAARAVSWLATLQFVLGLVALWLILPLGGNPRPATVWQAMTRTAHQTNGALLLATTVVLALRAARHLRQPAEAEPPAVEPQAAPRALEVVA